MFHVLEMNKPYFLQQNGIDSDAKSQKKSRLRRAHASDGACGGLSYERFQAVSPRRPPRGRVMATANNHSEPFDLEKNRDVITQPLCSLQQRLLLIS